MPFTTRVSVLPSALTTVCVLPTSFPFSELVLSIVVALTLLVVAVAPLGASPSNRNIGHTACGCVSIMVDRAFREQSRAAGRSCR
jgi:hypothetical protein